jgi:hypothetical protein
MGDNINGPSLIRAPNWLPERLGAYYLYFADHRGTYIRLAYADHLQGPWRTYTPGTLQIEDTPFVGHIASPDVHVDHVQREIRMYYHGLTPNEGQRSSVAVSKDGVHFVGHGETFAHCYCRMFRWKSCCYILAMPGVFFRSGDGLPPFERGPRLFTPDMRHAAAMVEDSTLSVFYTNVGDCPEGILLSTIDLPAGWMSWEPSEPTLVLEPERTYEGADLPLQPSERGPAPGRVRQLRDPALYREGERTYLLYSVAGESGIAIAEIVDSPQAIH